MTGRSPTLARKLTLQFCAISLLIPGSIWLAQPLLEGLDWSSVTFALRQISPLQWAIALLATAGSFAAVGRYDVIVHRHLNTRQPERAVQLGGASAVALSQFLGLGLVTGTIARWRAIPSMSAAQAGMITALVSVSFLVAWLGLLGLSGILLPHSVPLPGYVYAACLFVFVMLCLYTAIRRSIVWKGTRLRLPSLRAMGAMTSFAALDTGLAAFVLWVLIPESAGLGYASIIPIYLTGLGIALVSNTPGGVGPFEVTLLWGMQNLDPGTVLAALIAFRLVYFAVPACLAALYLVTLTGSAAAASRRPVRVMCFDGAALHPEAHVARQGGSLLLDPRGTPLAPLRRTTQCTVALFDPPAGFDALLPHLVTSAAQRATWPLAYKIGARNALAARKHGWTIVQIAKDAMIDAKNWTRDGKSKSGLRRKLRKADKAGVCAMELDSSTPTPDPIWSSLQQIDAAWRVQNGSPRGFSMGRYCLDYLRSQRIFYATLNGAPIAFVSFHDSGQSWALDLVRARAACPDGTMHKLVSHAIETAQTIGVAEVSLAAVPSVPSPWTKHVLARYLRPAQGLIQFKRSFDPVWRPLYAAAPNALFLTLGLWDIWREVKAPSSERTPDTRDA